MAKVELIHPRSLSKEASSWDGFKMTVKEGPHEQDLPDELFNQQLYVIHSTPPHKIGFLVGAMNALMDHQTRRMNKEATELVKTVDKALTSCGYSCFHCFGLQEFGRYRVTSQQATLMDGILVQRSSLFIALATTPDSSNAPIETLHRLKLGRSVIALFEENHPRPKYREWLTEKVELGPDTNPSAIFLTYRDLNDLGQELRKIADFKYSLSSR